MDMLEAFGVLPYPVPIWVCPFLRKFFQKLFPTVPGGVKNDGSRLNKDRRVPVCLNFDFPVTGAKEN
jgi:hypothetical protein